MSIFDTDHLSDRPDDITAGPSVGWGEAIKQGFEQQFKVDSALSLDAEVKQLWEENLALLQERTGEQFDTPLDLGRLSAFRQNIDNPAYFEDELVRSDPVLSRMKAANDRITQLRDPEIRTFQEILQEVYREQQAIEGRSEDMSRRGDVMGQLIGAIGGSFTMRSPGNISTLPVGGAGRGIASRILSEMALAGAVTAAEEGNFVLPNREAAGLPKRSLALDVAVAMGGAGLFTGGMIGLGKAVSKVMGTPRGQVELDFRDNQLRQLFESMPESPRARAGASLLDDAVAFEKANPYGTTPTAEQRFLAELGQVARAISGEPETAIARALPPLPFEAIEKAVDYRLVKERSPEVYAKLEAAEEEVKRLDAEIADATSVREPTLIESVRLVDEEAADKLEALSVRVNDESLPEPERAAADLEANAIIQRVGPKRVAAAWSGKRQRTGHEISRMRAQRRSANQRYQAAYKAVEAERVRLNAEADAFKRAQQRNTVDLLGNDTQFIGPMLRFDVVEERVSKIEEINEAQADPETVRMTLDEEAGTVDVEGQVMPADFVVPFDDGELSVRAVMEDFAEDSKLEAAVRSCAI